ncbi:methyltransferase [Streptomyces colonosanans]|uniref:Methyltransferase n=2 Tax=Streptomyces colonosanans TaxID=1428652 RepID=A0A1S2Q6T1_9ACTN|nr:methyltransferase [Streptomyces colonosanans]
MLRLLEATPGATGVGIDLNEDDLARGRAGAEARGLAERVRFVQESAVDTTQGPADLVLCLGASHALSEAQPPEHTTAALRALRRLVTPGGRVLLGEAFWHRPPTRGELSAMWPDASASEFHDLAGLVDLAVAAGFRPSWIETAGRDEWEHFESAYQSDVEEWLAAHPDHPLAKETRDRVDRHRSTWLRGYRDVMGLAYLTLVPVS